MIYPSVKFIFDRRKRANADTKGTIDIRVTYDRKQKFISTGVQCYPFQWDARNECVKSSVESNTILASIRKKVIGIINNMVEADNIDLNTIPAMLKQKSVDITFIDYVSRRISERKVSEGTKNTYRTFRKRLMEWGKIVTFSDITEKNIRNFDEYLHTFTWKELNPYGKEVECRYTKATIEHMHKKMKIFINDAVIDGYIKENPYQAKRIRIEHGGTRIDDFLTVEELEQIMNARMPTNSLSETRDLFVFQSLTGLSYSDLMEFDFTKVRMDGEYKLYTERRVKTGVEFTFVLIPKAIEILKKYKYHLPHMSNQKYNMKLKVVADAAGIDRNLTTHDGRRTSGSIWLNSGVPIEVVSKALGHRSIATTQKAYAKILDKTVVQAFAEHVINKEK